MSTQANILYLGHDLDDAALWRRKTMFELGGASVFLAAFERGKIKRPNTSLSLGLTQDGNFKQRIWRVLMTLWGLPRRLNKTGARCPDVIVARNMEALALGVRLKAHWGGTIPLVYELLDIHKLQHGASKKSKVVRAVEAWLLKSTDLVLISSTAFKTHYLDAFGMPHGATILVENKVLMPSEELADRSALRRGPKHAGQITIGWFGILRCNWTLSQLDRLTRAHAGRFHITLRGRPALDQMPDFHHIVEANPDLHFGGAYAWPDDLDAIYDECDFVWMIDRFDSGGNSNWLLPNRLYEGGLFGAVPIGLAGTEIAAWLEAAGIGLILPDLDLETLEAAMCKMSEDHVARLREAVIARPLSHWLCEADDCRALVTQIVHCKTDTSAGSEGRKNG